MSRPPCSIAGCGRPNVGRGLCRLHYQRLRKTGDPLGLINNGRRSGRKGERLHSPGEHAATPIETPCREWLGLRTAKGYGVYRRRRLHRWIWEAAFGPIPRGMVVMHRCDNPPCFRLSHLALGTVAENQADMKSKGRARNASTSTTPSNGEAH